MTSNIYLFLLSKFNKKNHFRGIGKTEKFFKKMLAKKSFSSNFSRPIKLLFETRNFFVWKNSNRNLNGRSAFVIRAVRAMRKRRINTGRELDVVVVWGQKRAHAAATDDEERRRVKKAALHRGGKIEHDRHDERKMREGKREGNAI